MQFDMKNMLNQVKKMQDELEIKQKEVKNSTFTGEAGGGMITVKMLGTGKLTEINIDPILINANDNKMLEDLIVAAVNKAKDNLDKNLEEMMGGFSSMLPNIPGLNI